MSLVEHYSGSAPVPKLFSCINCHHPPNKARRWVLPSSTFYRQER